MTDCEPQDCAKMRGLLVACDECVGQTSEERDRVQEYKEKMIDRMWSDTESSVTRLEG